MARYQEVRWSGVRWSGSQIPPEAQYFGLGRRQGRPHLLKLLVAQPEGELEVEVEVQLEVEVEDKVHHLRASPRSITC